MWLFTQIGYFSIVVPEPHDVIGVTDAAALLVVRSRVREDLDRLRDMYIPSLSPTIETPSRDYLWRAFAHKDAVAVAMFKIASDIDYTNFKDSVKKYDSDRGTHYMDVWCAMMSMQTKYNPRKSTYFSDRAVKATKGQKRLPFPHDPILDPLFNDISVEPSETGGWEVVDRSKKKRLKKIKRAHKGVK